MATRVSDIARMAGVSRTTVLRALWDKSEINPNTKKRVLQIASEMKYRPNHVARTLVLGQSRFVGVIVAPSVLPSLHSVVGTIADRLREGGYSMLFYLMGVNENSDSDCVEEMLFNRVSGVIAIPGAGTADADPYCELVESGIKVVMIDRYIESSTIPQVMCDYYQSARMATEHLISLGHRRIAHLSMPEDSFIGQQRAKGFRDALVDAKIPLSDSIEIDTEFDEASGESSMRELLSLSDTPTGIVARHDLVARGAMRAVFEAGLSVPDDVSIVGNGDVPGADMFRSPLTTIRHPGRLMVDTALTKLLDVLNGSPVSTERLILGVELVVRSSCASHSCLCGRPCL